MGFHKDILRVDCKSEVERICAFIQQQVREMKREGAIIGLSGGIDSAVAGYLCVRALGKDKVFGLILPERESNPISAEYASKQAKQLGIRTETIDITSTLAGFGTYRRRDEVIKKIFPEYTSKYRLKITLPADLLSKDAFNVFTLRIDDGNGNVKSARLNKESLNNIVAATDTIQRTRMMHLYYYAEKMNYLVCGTTNKSETIQGFCYMIALVFGFMKGLTNLHPLESIQFTHYMDKELEAQGFPPQSKEQKERILEAMDLRFDDWDKLSFD